mgnify:CR=1 FL=1
MARAARTLDHGQVKVTDGNLFARLNVLGGHEVQAEGVVRERVLGVGRAAVVASALHGKQARSFAVQKPRRSWTEEMRGKMKEKMMILNKTTSAKLQRTTECEG